MRTKAAMLVGVLAFVIGVPVSAQTFDFDALPIGTRVPLTITDGGLAATFSSTTNFRVTTALFFSTPSGQALMDAGPTISPLTIVFGAPVNWISLAFVTNAPETTTGLTLQALNGATLVGSMSAPGAPAPGLLYPEGTLTFTGPAFTSVVLSSAARDFAIDNVTVRPSTVIPEPYALLLVATGAVLLYAARRRVERAGTPI